MRRWLIATLLAVAGFAAGSAAWGQVLSAPDEVVIYLHKDLKDTDFVEGLVCELSRVLAVPVRSDSTDLPVYRSYLATQTQIDVEKMRVPFDEATAEQGRSVFRYLLLPYDLKATGLNYVFSSTSLGGSTGVVMSTIRLIPREAGLSRKRVSDITGDRVYKLMLKSVALLAGLRSEDCIMKFPRNLPELDEKSAEFCPEDRAALVAARVLKDKPFGACNTVAMATR